MEFNVKKYVRYYWLLVAAPIVFLVLLFFLISIGALGFMPDFAELENPKSNLASEVFSADQQVIGKYYRQNRTVVTFDDLSPNVVNALIATEDARYHQHSGIDYRGLARVFVKTLVLQRHSGGGSTITQQLAKNLFPRDTIRNRSVVSKASLMALTKFKEWLTAIKLERRYTKEEILAMYLNTVPFGNNSFGIKAAAKTYFNTSPDSLKIEQAAVLIGLLRAPTYYSPVRNPKRSQTRRDVVMKQMVKYNYLKQEAYDSLRLIPLSLKFSKQSHVSGLAPHFREYLRNVMTKTKPDRQQYPINNYQKYKEDSLEWEQNPLYGWCNKNYKPNGDPYDIYRDGLRIYTTLNSKMQAYAEEAIARHLGTGKEPLQETFNNLQKNNSKAPFSYKLTTQQVNNIMRAAITRSERYRVYRANGMGKEDAIKAFEKPVEMTVFSWRGEIDTVMSPLDSIRYYKFFLHAGLMSVEPQTGYVRAYVGDINYKHFQYDNVKLAKRQVGSTFKPFIYTLAVMPGRLSPCHQIPNIPVSFETDDPSHPVYTPKFSGGGYLDKYRNKKITIKFGLAHSLNQVSAWILKQHSPQDVIKICRKMGIYSPIPEVPSICVGSPEITLAEMVGAYTTFGNEGVYIEPVFVTRIEDKNGNIIAKFKSKQQEVISKSTAYRMVDMMRGVVDNGTSTRIRYKYNIRVQAAGKTGTTNDNSDGWFIGFTPELLTGVWVGGEERSIRFANTYYGQGANMALPIWAFYMQDVLRDKDLKYDKNAVFQEPADYDGIETDCSKVKADSDDIPLLDDPLLGQGL